MARNRLNLALAAFAASLCLSGIAPSAFAQTQELTISEPSLPGAGTRYTDANTVVLEAVRNMPTGGRYSASQAAFDGLGRAISLGYGGLHIDASTAQPSFCSGATYLVFVQALD